MDKQRSSWHPAPSTQHPAKIPSWKWLVVPTMMLPWLLACKKDHGDDLGRLASDEGKNVTAIVQAFVEKARAASVAKIDEVLGLDSAEWYIEAALNYDLAEAWLECDEHVLDSIAFTLSWSGSGVAFLSVADAFNDLNTQISSMIQPGQNHLIAADVSLLPLLEGDTAMVYFVMGSGYSKSVNSEFGPDDHWGFGAGGVPNSNCGCDDYQGASGPCADKQIQQRVNAAIPLPLVGCFYTDVTRIAVGWFQKADVYLPHTNFPTGLIDTPYMVYYCTGFPGECGSCFSPAWMTFYTESAWELLQVLQPTERVPISYMNDGYFLQVDLDQIEYRHDVVYRYGRLQCPK